MADPNEEISLQMLGDDLKADVLAARVRLSDNTIMARISEGLVIIEQGGVVVAGGLAFAAAGPQLEAL